MGDPTAVSYSGSTYVSITAASHADDFRNVLELPAFKDLSRTSDNEVKPVLIFKIDGGPYENPRYDKVIVEAVKHFRNQNLEATNAPGRCASLIHQLAGAEPPLDHILIQVGERLLQI